MRDLICDDISYCASSFMIGVYIVI